SACCQMQKLPTLGKFHNDLPSFRATVSFPASLRLDVGCSDHLCPLLGLFGDQFAKGGGRAWKHRSAQVDKPCLDSGIGEGGVDLRVELIDDFSRRVPGRTETKTVAPFVAWHELTHGRDIWQ